jgi:hypothetical protein
MNASPYRFTQSNPSIMLPMMPTTINFLPCWSLMRTIESSSVSVLQGGFVRWRYFNAMGSDVLKAG